MSRTFWNSLFKFQIFQESCIRRIHCFPSKDIFFPLHLSMCVLGTILLSKEPPEPSLLVWLSCSVHLFNWASQLILSVLVDYRPCSFPPPKASPLSYLVILLPISPFASPYTHTHTHKAYSPKYFSLPSQVILAKRKLQIFYCSEQILL